MMQQLHIHVFVLYLLAVVSMSLPVVPLVLYLSKSEPRTTLTASSMRNAVTTRSVVVLLQRMWYVPRRVHAPQLQTHSKCELISQMEGCYQTLSW